jgi:glycosyltransferase involved in cell wall biosynthesis
MRWLDYRRVASKFRAEALREAPPDVIVASMPGYDLAAEAVAYARERSIPALVDIRDQWPESFVDPLPSWLRPLGAGVLSGETILMKRALSGADSLVSMSQAILDWGLIQAERHAKPSDLVFPLGGRSPEPGASPHSPELSRALRRAEGKLVVAFIGTFAHYHNPSVLIECSRLLKGSGIHFIIAGDGPLRAGLVAAANDSADIDFPGWLDQIDIDALLSRAVAGACTTDPGTARPFFPNKVFSYMAAGLPVLSAFHGEMRRLVESERIGFHFENVEQLASAVRRLQSEPDLRTDMGKRALRVFRDRFDSDGIYERYAEHVESVAATRGNHVPR